MQIDGTGDLFTIAPVQAEDVLFRSDPTRAADPLQRGEKSADSKRLEETAKQFEGLLLQQVLKQMKEATAQLEPEEEEEDSGEASSGEQIKSLFWTFLGDAVTEQGGFGLWETIHNQMVSDAKSANTAGLQGVDERI